MGIKIKESIPFKKDIKRMLLQDVPYTAYTMRHINASYANALQLIHQVASNPIPGNHINVIRRIHRSNEFIPEIEGHPLLWFNIEVYMNNKKVSPQLHFYVCFKYHGVHHCSPIPITSYGNPVIDANNGYWSFANMITHTGMNLIEHNMFFN